MEEYQTDREGDSRNQSSVPSTTSHNTKSECLNLISQIWKNDLGDGLDRIGKHNTLLPHEGEMEPKLRSCEEYEQAEGKLFALPDKSHTTNTWKKDSVLGSDQTDTLVNCLKGPLEDNYEMYPVEPGDGLPTDGDQLNLMSKPGLLPNSDNDDCQGSLKHLQPTEFISQDGDLAKSEVPPFKKARYSWQVKNRVKDIVSDGVAMATTSIMMDASTNKDDVAKMGYDCQKSNIKLNIKSEFMLGNSSSHLSVSLRDVEMSHDTSPKTTKVCSRDETTDHVPCHHVFNKLSAALTQLTHTERWQCQHVAKAIVDNAINKTLEEMGLAPGSSGTVYHEQRSRIEDAGVSQAILSRGLRRYAPDAYCMRRLNPLIDHLTSLSEDILTDHLADHEEEVLPENDDSSMGNGQLVSTEMMGIYFDLGESPARHSNTTSEDTLSNVSTSPSPSCNMNTNIDEVGVQLVDTEQVTSNREYLSSNEDKHIKVMIDPGSLQGRSSKLCDKQSAVMEQLERGPSSKYILDQAVNAVICEQGLQCQGFF